MYHPDEHWMLLANGASNRERTELLKDRWSVDLTSSSEPLRKLEEPERRELAALLTECSKMENKPDDKGWTLGERLKHFFEIHNMGRNNVEEMLATLGISSKVRVHYNEGKEDPYGRF